MPHFDLVILTSNRQTAVNTGVRARVAVEVAIGISVTAVIAILGISCLKVCDIGLVPVHIIGTNEGYWGYEAIHGCHDAKHIPMIPRLSMSLGHQSWGETSLRLRGQRWIYVLCYIKHRVLANEARVLRLGRVVASGFISRGIRRGSVQKVEIRCRHRERRYTIGRLCSRLLVDVGSRHGHKRLRTSLCRC
jgi:hypothetical protein